MKYLLVTMVWLWSLGPTEKIGKKGLAILSNGGAQIYLSACSSWEIAIKTRTEKFRLPEAPGVYIPARLAQQGIRPLSITQGHAIGVYDLPLHHNDPFDRLLIAQAIDEGMVVLTADRLFGKYPIEIIWCGN